MTHYVGLDVSMTSWYTAARCYRKALKHNPDLAPIWVQYGHALKESGSILEAEAAYRRSLRFRLT